MDFDFKRFCHSGRHRVVDCYANSILFDARMAAALRLSHGAIIVDICADFVQCSTDYFVVGKLSKYKRGEEQSGEEFAEGVTGNRI
ncbi:MAG: hypothetical protein C0490_28265 [Marivirga sp.]|nr:hypothetical protein [Marivirga sp.]